MQNSNYAVTITKQLAYTYPYPAKCDYILAWEIMKIWITIWMFCTQINVTCHHQTISTSIICVSVLVSSLINIQKQNMIYNFHVWVKTGKQRNICLLENVINSSIHNTYGTINHTLRFNSRHFQSVILRSSGMTSTTNAHCTAFI